jgi:hypothetical protein
MTRYLPTLAMVVVLAASFAPALYTAAAIA